MFVARRCSSPISPARDDAGVTTTAVITPCMTQVSAEAAALFSRVESVLRAGDNAAGLGQVPTPEHPPEHLRALACRPPPPLPLLLLSTRHRDGRRPLPGTASSWLCGSAALLFPLISCAHHTAPRPGNLVRFVCFVCVLSGGCVLLMRTSQVLAPHEEEWRLRAVNLLYPPKGRSMLMLAAMHGRTVRGIRTAHALHMHCIPAAHRHHPRRGHCRHVPGR
eukprot:COSAG01_NODE_1584_length_9799_cov_4.529636_5_plen_221_part_00